jgi:formylglycine-generating enzyme required for sulfatase activity/energy-coupling factor transporter ATP-binding protein EcfA2
MVFDLEIWKQAAKGKLQKIGDWLNHKITEQTPYVAYCALCSLTLWPLIEAAKAGQLLPVMVALASVAGNVGGNLIAEQVTRWKDQADGPVEAEVAAWVRENVITDAKLREGLDDILEKLDAIDYAQTGLKEPARQWFTETLRAEMNRLGNLARFEVILGPEAKVAGDRGVVADNIHGTVYTGDIGTVVQIGSIIAPQETGQPIPVSAMPVAKTVAPRETYLKRLLIFCNALPLAALGGEEGADEDITLDRVYIQLNTTTPVPKAEGEKKEDRLRQGMIGRDEETRLLTALEAAQSTRLMLLGDPGSGKSTFVRKLLGWLAAAQIGGIEPPPGIPADLLPILLDLRDLTPRLAGLNLDALPEDRQHEILASMMRDEIVDSLGRIEVDTFIDGMKEALLSGKCLLVLDGLDEVPYHLRARVRQVAAAMIGKYRLQHVILTCRVRSYVGETVFPGFKSHTLAPFNHDQINQFSVAWYNAQKDLGRFDAEQAKKKAEDLGEAALSEDLHELSSNPMMLTTMAIIHQREIGLPKERVRLYNLAVDVLLLRWQKRKTGDRGLTPSARLTEFFKDNVLLREVMERLAYEAHHAGLGQKDAADLPRGKALTLLEKSQYLSDPGLAADFLDYVDQRAGLLVGRGGEPGHPATYSFPHRTFQEYLAGCYMVGQRDAVREFFKRAGEGDYWSLAVQLGAEELLYNRRNTGINALLDLSYSLCPGSSPVDEKSKRAVLWSGQMATLLGRDVVERDDGRPDGGKIFLGRLIPRMVDLLSSDLIPFERAECGRILAKLGDPRKAVTTIEKMEFCLVPAGLFWMGEDDDEHLNERLNYDFWISRCLVTNFQFEAFVKAGGYNEKHWWTDDGWRYREKENIKAPRDFREPFNLSNHPMVGVSWYEALAFTRWLTEQLQNKIPKGYKVQPPSEAEWEKAARGGVEITDKHIISSWEFETGDFQMRKNPQDKRRYPWGNDEPDPNRANYNGSGIGATSAVGCFPGDDRPYGAQDMSGNVWEWTRSLWGKDWEEPDCKYPYDPKDKHREDLRAGTNVLRVLRGGSILRGACAVLAAVGAVPATGTGVLVFV